MKLTFWRIKLNYVGVFIQLVAVESSGNNFSAARRRSELDP